MRPPLSICFAILLVQIVAATDEPRWVSVKQKAGIEVFRREVPGSDFQELKAVGHIRSSVDVLVQILSDVESQIRWIPLCVESKLLPGAPAGAQRIYRRYGNPWPFQDVDLVIDQTVWKSGADGEVVVSFQVANAGPGKKDCCGRMREYQGSWRLVPAGEGMTDVTYIVHIVPEGNTFSSILNASMGKIGWDTFHGLRTLQAGEPLN